MTKDAIYQALLAYITDLDAESQTAIHKALERDMHFADIPGICSLMNLMVDLKADIIAETAKSTGKGNMLKSAMYVIKDAKSRQRMEWTHGAFMQNGAQYVCNGYMAIRFFEPLDLPKTQAPADMNIEQLFTAGKGHETQLELPNIADLKARIKFWNMEQKLKLPKLREPAHYDFPDSDIRVNAEWLLTILEAIPDALIFGGKQTQPVYFFGGTIDAILLPIRKKEAA